MPDFLRQCPCGSVIVVLSTSAHWETINGTKGPDAMSWHRPHLDVSLRLIEGASPDRSASILEVGGGESTLGADLVGRGYRNVTVLDLALTALRVSKQRCAPDSTEIRWCVRMRRGFPSLLAHAMFDMI